MHHYWQRKTLLIAIFIGITPAVGLGLVLLGQAGRNSSPAAISAPLDSSSAQDPPQSPPGNEPQTLRLPLVLWLGVGTTALLSGGLAWLWLRVFVHAMVRQTTRRIEDLGQSHLSESLQDLGRAVGLMQAQTTGQDLFEVAAIQVRSLLKVDRVLLFCAETVGGDEIAVEECSDPQQAILKQDLSQLPLPLREALRVPTGYVQVCAEVEGSDLPAQGQAALMALGVKAQMVTHIIQDNVSLGIIAAQQTTGPRDWSAVEYQLFAALAKQVALAIERLPGSNPLASSPTRSFSTPTVYPWQDYQAACLTLSQNAALQTQHIQALILHLQELHDLRHGLQHGADQAQTLAKDSSLIMQEGQTALNQALASLSGLQETLVRMTLAGEQLAQTSQQARQLTDQIRQVSDQMNYQAMNASIVTGRQANPEVDTLDLSNEILQMHRQIKQKTSELNALTARTGTELQTLMGTIDQSNEQLVVGLEWFKEVRQKLNGGVAQQVQLESLTQRMGDQFNQHIHLTAVAQEQTQTLVELVNRAAEQSGAMAASMDQRQRTGA